MSRVRTDPQRAENQRVESIQIAKADFRYAIYIRAIGKIADANSHHPELSVDHFKRQKSFAMDVEDFAGANAMEFQFWQIVGRRSRVAGKDVGEALADI